MSRRIKIALSGNPNSGKSTVFNALTGARQHIANYPGVTVEKKYGIVRHKGYEIEVVDLPGTYSLTAYSLEELVARDYLVNEKPDVVVDIVDASNLDRNLYLAVQFKELGVPLVLALNMVDVAEARGIVVDKDILETLFGAPVVPTVARSNKGIQALLDRVIEVAREDRAWKPDLISYGRDVDQSLNAIEAVLGETDVFGDKYAPRWLALKYVEGDDQIEQLIQPADSIHREIETIRRRTSKHIFDTLEDEPEGIIADHRYGHIAGITKKAVKRKIESRLNLSDRIDQVLTNRFIGPVIMMAILYGIYEITFWASEGPVNGLESFFGWLKTFVSSFLPEGILNSLIISGVIDGVGGVLGFVPLIMFMFFAIAIMEDSGYMARVAYMLDRLLRWFGLHGNSVMALIISGGISGGCAVPGVMATRTLRDPKERIATLLVVPFMNCGAKLPVFSMLIAAFFVKGKAEMLFLFTLLSWAFALFAAKMIRSTVLRGPKTPFVMELPPYRVPTLKGLCIHTWERTWQYIKKAGTIILGISIILWCMMTFPRPSEDETASYEDQRHRVRAALVSSGIGPALVKNPATLKALDELYDKYGEALIENDPKALEDIKKDPLFPEIQKLASGDQALRSPADGDEQTGEWSAAYHMYRKRLARVVLQEQEAALRGTVAGRIGSALEVFTNALGFDYRVNVALLGGFAAKEVIISTLGTAYSLGETDPEGSGALSNRLRKDPGWSPLLAFTLIIFTMLYVPCFATVVAMKKESSWRWAGFSVFFNLTVAFLMALIVYQGGKALGLG